MDKLLKLLSKLPDDQYVKFCVEGRLVVYFYKEAPEDGWETRGDFFGHPPDAPSCKIPCPKSWKYMDRVESAICSDMNDFPHRILEEIEKRIIKSPKLGE